MIDKLPEIKKILNKFPQVLIDIKEFSVDCIEYKVENKRLCYVLEYLHYYQNKMIDCREMCRFYKYKPGQLFGDKGEILKKYFLAPLMRVQEKQKQKQVKPTYYHFCKWLNDIFKKCRLFTKEHKNNNKDIKPINMIKE